MNLKDRIKVIFFILLTIFLVAIALPEFKINAFDKEIKFETVNFKAIGLDATIGDFRNGKDVYPSTNYYSQIEFEEGISQEDIKSQTKSIIERVRKRATYADLYDLEISSVISDSEALIKINVPNYYQYPDILADYLTKRGELEIYAVNSLTQENIIDLSIEEIIEVRTGSVRASTTQGIISADDAIFETLILVFDESKADDFITLGLAQNNVTQEEIQVTAAMNIDGFQALSLTIDRNNDNWLRAFPESNDLPLEEERDSEIYKNIVNIVQSYFQEEEPITQNIFTINSTENVERDYAFRGYKFASIAFLTGLFIIMITSLRLLDVRPFLSFLFNNFFTLLLTFVLLKIILSKLSYAQFVGFIFIIILNTYIHYVLTKAESRVIYKTQQVNFRYLLVSLAILCSIVIVLGINMLGFNQILGVMISYVVAFILSSLVTQEVHELLVFKNIKLKNLIR